MMPLCFPTLQRRALIGDCPTESRVGHMSDTEPLHKPKAVPVRRLEVFTRSGRRRAWTAEQKARIVAETHESGETVSAVARRHGLTPQQLFGRRRRARPGAQDRSGDSGAAFAPVMVEAARPGAAMAMAMRSPVIEIRDRRRDGSGSARD
jgi:transposase-like protein